MQKLGLNEIREKYLSFFESKGHLRLPSFPLVPQNDTSLLLINAGMAPLKPYFTGKETPPSKRVTTCQKCIRTPDIERVGKTARHGTFFEMLGNFSFGDYFKIDATKWAWEFVTEVMQIPTDRLWVSVYENDDEAVDIWVNHVGIDKNCIVKLGKDDNFWEIGTGPCGPCSEIYYDRGADVGCGSPDCAVGCDCDRFVEFWNLVFTQFDRDDEGTYHPLANPNIDTGMGLERIACIMQGVNSLFEVDTVRKVLDHVAQTANVKYGDNAKTDESIRIVTDHIRSTVFLVCDGVLPSNEGRGYVLRRLLRRAARNGRLLGIKNEFLYSIAQTVIEQSKDAYPELAEKAEYIEKIIRLEEQKFAETIDQGLSMLSDFIKEIKTDGGMQLDGEKAFKLYDTYGFPVDLTKEILGEVGFALAEDVFAELMNRQRSMARNARSNADGKGWDEDLFANLPATKFDGYSKFEGTSKILALAKDGVIVTSANSNDKIDIVVDQTVFYAESGGQVGDTGYFMNDNTVIEIIDTKKQAGRFIHKGIVKSGTVSVNDTVSGKINISRRGNITRNHSAAHLLQQALRNTLGQHITQAGSYVADDRVRFDFSHFSAMTDEEIISVETQINEQILNNLPVATFEENLAKAKQMGAVALFGEKYGETVRVVKMGDYSTELCGGCHVKNTGEIGLFKLISESGVASGVRRIEGITGLGVLNLIKSYEQTVGDTAQALKTATGEIVIKANGLMEELKNSKREIESLKGKLAQGAATDLTDNIEEINGIKLLAVKLDDGLDMNSLRAVGDNLKQKFDSAVIVLASVADDSVNLIAMATKDAISKGAHAGNIIRETAKIMGGGGGGKPDSAQAGGKDKSKLNEALQKVKELLKQ